MNAAKTKKDKKKRLLGFGKKSAAAQKDVLKDAQQESQEVKAEPVIPVADLPVMVKESPHHVYDAYIVNLSGTLFSDDLLMPGVDKVLESLAVMRRPVFFMSSNSHTSPDDYQVLLKRLGIDASMEQIFTPVRVAIEYMQREFLGKRVYAIGDEKFVQHLAAARIPLTDDPHEIDVVLVAHDRDFSFSKLNIAFQALVSGRGVKLVTTSMVRNWPKGQTSDFEPGTRGLVRAIESASRAKLHANLGTPESGFLDCLFTHLDVPASKVLLVSDSLTGDIRMAKDYGVPTALVLTGEARLEEAEALKKKDQPHFVLNSVADVLPAYISNQL